MNLYKYTCGVDERYGAASDDADAYARRSEVDPTFFFLPVAIERVTVPGYEVVLRPVVDFGAMDKLALRAWLDGREVEYVPQWSEQRLRELVKQKYEEENAWH